MSVVHYIGCRPNYNKLSITNYPQTGGIVSWTWMLYTQTVPPNATTSNESILEAKSCPEWSKTVSWFCECVHVYLHYVAFLYFIEVRYFSYPSMLTNLYEYIYIHPKLLRIRSVSHPKFPASCDSFEKNATLEEQALNNGSTVGGPVAVWMPSQGPQQPTSGCRTNQRMNQPADVVRILCSFL